MPAARDEYWLSVAQAPVISTFRWPSASDASGSQATDAEEEGSAENDRGLPCVKRRLFVQLWKRDNRSERHADHGRAQNGCRPIDPPWEDVAELPEYRLRAVRS